MVFVFGSLTHIQIHTHKGEEIKPQIEALILVVCVKSNPLLVGFVFVFGREREIGKSNPKIEVLILIIYVKANPPKVWFF